MDGWGKHRGERREEKKEQNEMKIKAETETHTQRRRNVGNKTTKAKKGERNIKQ